MGLRLFLFLLAMSSLCVGYGMSGLGKEVQYGAMMLFSLLSLITTLLAEIVWFLTREKK